MSWRVIGDEVVIVQSSGQEVHDLNSAGSLIWCSIDGEKSSETLSNEVVEAFDVDLEQARQDTHDFLMDLKAKNLIEI